MKNVCLQHNVRFIDTTRFLTPKKTIRKGVISIMGMVKKVLYAVLITSLLLGGTIIAAVISGRVESDSINEDENYDFILGDFSSSYMSAGTRPPRNTIVRPTDNEYWMYYPDFPSDATPGSLVTLSAPIHGFVGWEVDDRFGSVDISDQTSDENNVYVTFTMPDEDVAVRALFGDVQLDDIPGVPVAPFDALMGDISPMAAILPITLRQGMFALNYSSQIPSTSLPVGTWPAQEIIFTPESPEAGPNWVFNELTGTVSNINPRNVGTFSFNLSYNTMVEDPENLGSFIPGVVPVPITLTILPAIIIIPDSETVYALSDGMHNVEYSQSLSANNIPALGEWVFLDDGRLPPGLTLNMTTGVISGIPALPPTTTPVNYTFTVSVELNPLIPDNRFVGGLVATQDYSINIWPHPEIKPRENNVFLDGMVDQRYFDSLTGAANRNSIDLVNFPAPGHIGSDKFWTLDIKWERDGDIVVTPGIELVYESLFPETPSNLARLESPPGVSPAEEEYGDYIITITLKPRVANDYVATVSQSYTLKIWERPVFIPHQTRGFRLLDGMDALRRYGDLDTPYDGYGETVPPPPEGFTEPEDEPYGDLIHVSYPIGMNIDWWEWPDDPFLGGTLPPGLRLGASIKEENSQSTTVAGSPRNVANTPLDTKDYPFTVKITAKVTDNPNINGAEVSQNYNMTIWARRYLYLTNIVDGTGTTSTPVPRGYVIRDGESWTNIETRPAYTSRRAVMPGTEGVSRLMLAGTSGFMRWEVVNRTNPESIISIGGPSRGGSTGYWIDNPFAFTKITMPTRNSAGGFADRDVFLQGIDSPVPRIIDNFDSGRVGRIYSGGASFEYPDEDIGDGAGTLTWSVEAGDEIDKARNSPLPGLVLRSISFPGTSFMQSPPEKEGTFRFTLGATLPGTMRLEWDFSILILGFNFGDVNGDGYVNLEDLVILARYLEGERDFERFDMRAADLNGNGVIDSGDLRILAMFFARPLASLPSDILASVAELP